MRRLGFILGVVFFGLGLFILVYAEGLRRWYAGLFFILLGLVTFLNALVRKEDPGE